MECFPNNAINFQAFGLQHDSPHMFYSPQYSIPMPIYVLYKVAAFAYTLIVLILQFGEKSTKSPWIYFTNWSYILQCSSFLLASMICAWRAMKIRCKRPDQIEIPLTFGYMNWYLKLRWVLHNIVSTVPYMVTIVYWTILWPTEQQKERIPGFLHTTIQVHGVNSFLALMDQLMDCTPIKIHHFYHSLVFMVIYSIFSMIHGSTGAQPIYPFLDWQGSPGWALLVSFLVYLTVMMFHVIAIVIKKLQLKYCCHLTVDPVEDYISEQTPLLISYSTITN